ncbi:NADH-cytochrome b5 reductase-like isoform X3 [Mus musculus]|uniref:NADH-cytochrome b5 reductase-like isoform X3 n=1 Tax=Mus musculus TaxID=10090 RepID=UPI0003D6E370|nr:NADH-cytochrome b5 reductase-like isoform X3 [Mus musculus]|eukprot:XP_006503011.1 PREDICTED: NADH-cytochrome b5 reductase-like isoform X3 [Mus musculus]
MLALSPPLRQFPSLLVEPGRCSLLGVSEVPHVKKLAAPLTMAETEEEEDSEAWLRLKPVEPLPSQCCGSGCSPCVFDLYYRDLERWETARARNDRSLLSGKQPPESQSCSAKLSPETFLAFHISTMEKVTKDTYLVRFTLPGNSRLGLRPGQHLILRGVVDGLEIQRAYTPISPVTAEGYFDVLIKCYRTGLMSQYVESWRTGDTAFWRGPFGSFLYEPKKEATCSPHSLLDWKALALSPQHAFPERAGRFSSAASRLGRSPVYGELLMLAAGTGLAPMVPILQSITDDEDDETFVTLVGCFKTFEGIYLKTFFQEQARFWNVQTFFVLSQLSVLLRCLAPSPLLAPTVLRTSQAQWPHDLDSSISWPSLLNAGSWCHWQACRRSPQNSFPGATVTRPILAAWARSWLLNWWPAAGESRLP